MAEREALEWNDAVVDFVRENRIGTVVIAANWSNYSVSSVFRERLEYTISLLHAIDCRVVLIKDVAQQSENVLQKITSSTIWRSKVDLDDYWLAYPYYCEEEQIANAIFDDLMRTGIEVLDPSPYFTKNDMWYFGSGDKLYYRDPGHLSLSGGLHLKEMFLRALAARK